MIPDSSENQISVQINELKTMLAAVEDPELIARIVEMIKKLSAMQVESLKKPETEEKSLVQTFGEIRTKQLLQGKEITQPSKTRKTKVRLFVPEGSRARVQDGKSRAEKVVLPPGEIKFTGVGEDGKLEAEVVGQMSASDYMKRVEETSRTVAKNAKNKKVSIAAKNRANKARDKRKEMMMSSATPDNQSEIAKMTLEKSNSLVERAADAGLNLFTQESIKVDDESISLARYYTNFDKALISAIRNLKNDNRIKLFDEANDKVRKLISDSSETQLRLAVRAVALLIHQDIDRRARLGMSKSSLEGFLASGKILNIDVDSQSLKMLKAKRDRMLGNRRNMQQFSFVPVELMHGGFVRKTEEMLYSSGTRVGSEEYADSGRGIELVLRSENSPRIGYGRKDSYEEGGVFAFINEDDERIIELAIFGGDGDMSKDSLIEILDAYVSGDPSSILRKNNEDTLEAFIVGEVSLNDIEHIKIPLSIFNVRKKRVPATNLIGGKNRLSVLMRGRKLTEDKISAFFDKDGTIGGGYSPKYLSYLLEYEAATELKDRLISFGVQDVIFTNKDGIDIMAEKTWITPKPDQKFGIDALREIAKREVEAILDKYAPMPSSENPKPKKAES